MLIKVNYVMLLHKFDNFLACGENVVSVLLATTFFSFLTLFVAPKGAPSPTSMPKQRCISV